MTSDDDDIDKVWDKGQKISGKNPDDVRQDACGTEMHRNDHGDRGSQYGWEIDHIDPNGGDELSNRRPLQWENNNNKSDGKLKCDCSNKEA